MKTIVLFLTLVLTTGPMAKVQVPEYNPRPIVIINDDGELELYYPPLEENDTGSAKI
jgi:hypothetical protein